MFSDFSVQEYDNLKAFILRKYNIDIEKNNEIKELCISCTNVIVTLKIWHEHFKEEKDIFPEAINYFSEIISNFIHVAILSVIDLNIPAFIMIRRSQENLLNYIYYTDHPIEFYKKEQDDNRKNINGFKELKEYIYSYPFSIKYNVNNQNVERLCKKILEEWSLQYKQLSHYVHGSNTKYMDKVQFFDNLNYDKATIKLINNEIQRFCDITNSLLITMYFDIYREFDDDTEKKFIRMCITNKTHFKSKIIEVFKEI